MKTRNALVLIAVCFLLATTSNCSAKKVTTGNDQKTDKVSLLEADVYSKYLIAKLESIKETKKKLLEAVKNGDEKAEMALEELAEEENQTDDRLSEAKSNVANQSGLVTFKIGPLPPCPVVGECNGLKYLIVSDQLKILSGTLLDSQKNKIGTIQTTPENDQELSGLNLYKINLDSKIKGDFVINISKIDEDGVEISYETPYSIN